MSNCLGNCVDCLKVNYSLFKDLSKAELKTLNFYRKKYNFTEGEVIYSEGNELEGLVCLNNGKVKLVRKGKIEKEFIVSLHKTVDFIGFDDLMFNGIATSSAIALENVSICVIDKKQFFEVVKNNADLALKIIVNQSGKTIKYQDRLINVAQSNLISRMAFAINEIIEFFGFEADEKTIAIELKRKEIGAIANMNTSNVIRILAKMKKDKILNTNMRKIIVSDRSKILELID